jgi:hypothetical protein
MTGTSKRNIEIFKELCGEGAYPNIAVLTAMWTMDVFNLEYTKELQREEQLRDNYLLDILEEGGLMFRVDSKSSSSIDERSAKNIFTELFNSWKDDKITLKIQHELVNDPHATLNQTAAGKVLLSHMEESFELHKSEIQEIGETLRNDATETSKESNLLREQRKEIEECLSNIRRDQQNMQLSLLEIHVQERDRLVNEIERLEQSWKEEMRRKEREQRHREQILLELLRADEDRRKMHSQEQRVRDEQHKAELERIKAEMQTMRQETNERLNATQKAKKAWMGPLLQGLASGGLGLGQ